MQGVVFKNKPGALGAGQTVFNERQIQILVAAVKFVTDNGMADMREVDADLMFAAGARQDSQQGKMAFAPTQTPLDPKFSLRRRTVGAHAILHGDEAVFVPAERRGNDPPFRRDVAVDDGKIFLFNGAVFQNFPESARDPGIFGDEDHAAGFAVEAVDEMRWRGTFQMQPRAADQTGSFAVFGRMADESRRFVDDQQFTVFKNDVEQIFHFHRLFSSAAGVSFAAVKEKWNRWLPLVFVVVFAVSRIPGLLPLNFSAAYAFAFCAGVYFRGATAWWLPLGVMAVTDVALNLFYYRIAPFGFYLLLNYAVYAALIGLGKWFGPRAPFYKLLSGGLLGAVIFYLVTNTLSWLQDPGYARTIAGWIQALTVGHPGIHPATWEFFRNTLLSGGIFTALFVAAAKLTAPAESPAEKNAGAREAESETKEPAEETGA
jgi:hypothetical protein